MQTQNLKTAGWGHTYSETTLDGKILTSCMTDQNGPKPNNFRPCKFDEVNFCCHAITFKSSHKILSSLSLRGIF